MDVQRKAIEKIKSKIKTNLLKTVFTKIQSEDRINGCAQEK